MKRQDLQELLKRNYFELFNLPIKFKIDLSGLEQGYHRLQKCYHPDFVNSEKNKSEVTLLSAQINEAYNTLKSPTRRAKLILELNGHTINFAENTELPANFLLEQMETHEEIEVANNDIDKLDQIITTLHTKKTHVMNKIENEFEQHNFPQIIELLKQLSFYDKLILLVDNHIQNAL